MANTNSKITSKGLKGLKHKPKLLIIAVVAIFGLATLLVTQAASYSISVEPESGEKSGNINPINDPSASGRAAIQFANKPPSGATLFDDFNTANIDPSVWQVATWNEHGGQTGHERTFIKDGKLNMVFRNDSQKGFLSSAIQTRKLFKYGTWKASLKPTSCRGVLNSMYTIDWDDPSKPGDADGSKEEIDIEFLTNSFSSNSGRVHFALHKAGKQSWDTNPDVPLAFNPSDAFRTYGFTVTPEKIEWFVDNESNVLKTYKYSGNPISIDNGYNFKLNVWSQYGQWIGGPPAQNTDCAYQIDWIQFKAL